MSEEYCAACGGYHELTTAGCFTRMYRPNAVKPRGDVISDMREFAKECLRRFEINPRVAGQELHTRETYADILILCELAEERLPRKKAKGE